MEEVDHIEYVPHPPLLVVEAELQLLDEAIQLMLKLGKRRSISVTSVRYETIFNDNALRKRLDELIAETLTALKRVVPEDTGEKLFERISKVIDGWQDVSEQRILAVIYLWMMDTMIYMVAFRKKFRGIEREPSISKKDALAELKTRGLGTR